MLSIIFPRIKGDFQTGGKYETLIGELETREPFLQILSEDWDTSLPSAWEVSKIQEDLKALKRHKHDKNSGDVMIRI